jgi:hypothetical protein
MNAPGIGAPVSMEMHEPDEEDLRSYLLDFRKFTMERESVFINRVFNVAHQHVTADLVVEALKDARREWNREQEGSIGFIVNDQRITAAAVIDLWINGYYFHRDAEKRRRLEALAQLPLTRFHFLDAVVSASKVIFFTGQWLKAALRDGLISEHRIR